MQILPRKKIIAELFLEYNTLVKGFKFAASDKNKLTRCGSVRLFNASFNVCVCVYASDVFSYLSLKAVLALVKSFSYLPTHLPHINIYSRVQKSK